MNRRDRHIMDELEGVLMDDGVTMGRDPLGDIADEARRIDQLTDAEPQEDQSKAYPEDSGSESFVVVWLDTFHG